MDKNEYVKRWLWHAFNGLDIDGTVDPQQLKVLTAHVGSSLGADNKGNIAYKAGERYRCTSTLAVCFSNYLDFLEEQGFFHNDKVDIKKLEQTLWMLCLKNYEKRDHMVVASPELKHLWQIFNFLAEPDSFPVSIDREEMMLLTEKLVVAMGMKWDLSHFDHVTKNLKLFTFTKMLVCFESAFAKGMDRQCIAEAVIEVYNEIIEEVEMKGFLHKKGHMMKNWKERWFILKPGCLSYYTGRNEKDKKGDISICGAWKTETILDQKNYKNCFAIWTEDKNDKDKTRYELSASDPRTRSTWMIALNAIIQRVRSGGQGQYGELLKRRERRKKQQDEEEEERRLQEEDKRKREAEQREERRRQEEERRRAAEELEDVKKREEEERKLRQQEKEARGRAEEDAKIMNQVLKDTEDKLKQEEILRKENEEEEEKRRHRDEEERKRIEQERDDIKRALKDAKEADQKRLAELEETLRHLQMLLDEEKRARMEEQQAKQLQQRLLEEETQKREHLERLKEEQARLLEQEQQRREHLEVKSEELTKEREMQEAVLEVERVRLAELEEQRHAADVQLKVAMEKISITEKNRAVIQRKREQLSKITTSLGLAQPVRHVAPPLITHRGLPAFEAGHSHQAQMKELKTGDNAVDDQSTANGHL